MVNSGLLQKASGIPAAGCIQQNHMKFTPEQAGQVFEAVCWCILLYILAAPIVLPHIAHALSAAGLP